jgi:hypothetical protein
LPQSRKDEEEAREGMTEQEQITFFFAPPVPEQSGDARSPLHLLRREVQDCFIGRFVSEDQVLAIAAKERHRLFATVMVMMAGIDLLSKFYAGDASTLKVGERFTAFTKAFMFKGYSAAEAEKLSDVLWVGCRNPILHSFHLKNDSYRITLASAPELAKGPVWRAKGQPDTFAVSVEGLYQAFVNAVAAYQAELLVRPELRTNFKSVLSLGRIGMHTYTMQPMPNPSTGNSAVAGKDD